MRKVLLLTLFFIGISVLPFNAFAQNSFEQKISVVKARVVEIISERTEDYEDIDGFAETTTIQEIRVRILEGEKEGNIVEFSNDYLALKSGETFYLNIIEQPDGTISYNLNSPYRLNTLFIFLILFLIVVCWLGGRQGIRGLISLAGSLILIVFVLIPSILSGFSPIVASLGIASVIIIAGSYITHGFNKTTTAAVAGMMVTILITGVMAYYAMNVGRLEGLDEHAIYLNIGSQINIDLTGLLFGAILIGLLGVLYDAAISQAIAIEELHRVAPHLNRWVIYKRGIRIGREHIGALVDTLAIAYVGASLPLLLLYAKSNEPFLLTINQEIFATEIIRILVSSIGLILAVPLTTLLAAYIIIKDNSGSSDEATIKKEEKDLDHVGHI